MNKFSIWAILSSLIRHVELLIKRHTNCSCMHAIIKSSPSATFLQQGLINSQSWFRGKNKAKGSLGLLTMSLRSIHKPTWSPHFFFSYKSNVLPMLISYVLLVPITFHHIILASHKLYCFACSDPILFPANVGFPSSLVVTFITGTLFVLLCLGLWVRRCLVPR